MYCRRIRATGRHCRRANARLRPMRKRRQSSGLPVAEEAASMPQTAECRPAAAGCPRRERDASRCLWQWMRRFRAEPERECCVRRRRSHREECPLPLAKRARATRDQKCARVWCSDPQKTHSSSAVRSDSGSRASGAAAASPLPLQVAADKRPNPN